MNVEFNIKSESLSQWLASCEKGFESILEKELTSFGAVVTEVKRGIVSFDGTTEVAMRSCLWSRVAIRVLKPLVNITLINADDIYETVSKFAWNEVFDTKKSFSVDVASSNSYLKNSHFAALRVKDAIVDYFQHSVGDRPEVITTRPDVKLFLYLTSNEATLNLDFSGESLHKRGYRIETVEAPIKEHLAAGILLKAGWDSRLTEENIRYVGHSNTSILLDPFCGGGTFLIEAAMIATDTAPGLTRKYFGFFGLRLYEEEAWHKLKNEALLRSASGKNNANFNIIGYDASKSAIKAANKNITSAGFNDLIHVEKKELAHLSPPFSKSNAKPEIAPENCFIITNPPYGGRLGDVKSVRYLYNFFGKKLKENFQGWYVAVISDQVENLDSMKFDEFQSYKILHGGDSAVWRLTQILRQNYKSDGSVFSPVQIRHNVNLHEKCSEDLANRLKKNFKRIQKSFEKKIPYCFRLYDADLPEYNVAIDLYGDYAHVQEYAPPSNIDVERARERFSIAATTLRELFGIKYDNVFCKVRKKQKGKTQYNKTGRENKLLEVYEDSSRFLVNLRDYIDTGLFIDHRLARSYIEEHAKGKHFLNLFCYTGTASVRAAIGGAKSTTSVDLSKNYLDWARCNFNLNGFYEAQHRLISADVLQWLQTTTHQYDLIFIDPPTFSNSKKMAQYFDVQRQHANLLHLAMKHLAPGGEIIFSNNFKRFELDADALGDFHIEEVTEQTRSPDFVRKGHQHRTWLLCK